MAHDPIRTCIGCRSRAVAAELLRVVAAPVDGDCDHRLVVPDPRRRTPGRGAWLHPDRACVDLAVRRRAFGRALRVPDRLDPAPVHAYLSHGRASTDADPDRRAARARPGTSTPTSGTPQEMKS